MLRYIQVLTDSEGSVPPTRVTPSDPTLVLSEDPLSVSDVAPFSRGMSRKSADAVFKVMTKHFQALMSVYGLELRTRGDILNLEKE